MAPSGQSLNGLEISQLGSLLENEQFSGQVMFLYPSGLWYQCTYWFSMPLVMSA